MTLFRTEPPAGEPVTLADAKTFMRLETSDEDDLVETLIAAAVDHLEAETGLALITQGWRLCIDAWPVDGVVRLHRTPVQQVDAVTVYDGDGIATDIDASGAVIDAHARPARLCLDGFAAPGRRINGIEIDFTAGFGETVEDVPPGLRQALLRHVAHMYEFRGAVPASSQPASVPAGYARLIAPFGRRAL